MALPFVLSLLVACDPHDAEISGTYTTYFAESTSENILRIRESLDQPACEYVQSDPRTPKPDIDEDAIFTDPCYAERVAVETDFQAEWDLTPLDCRNLSDYNAIELRAAIIPDWERQYEAQCCVESWDDDDSNDPDGNLLTFEDCTRRTPTYVSELADVGYYVDNKPLDTWREEVVMTSEGDIQMTIHVTTRFGDFRVGWVIDPDFQPTECTEVDGKTSLQEIDGNWIEGWSNSNEEDEGYTVFFLNGNSAQINPSSTDDYWILDEDWNAGYGFSRLGDETFYLYSTDYYFPSYTPFWVATNDDGQVTGGYGNFGTEIFEELNCSGDGDNCNGFADYEDFVQMFRDNMNNGGENQAGDYVSPVDEELELYGLVSRDDQPFHMKVEDNSWRPTLPGEGGDAVGFDGWVGINPSWVRLKATQAEIAALEAGTLDKPLEGEFQVYLVSVSTASRQFVNGSFKINNIQTDRWGYAPTLDDVKRAENATPACGE